MPIENLKVNQLLQCKQELITRVTSVITSGRKPTKKSTSIFVIPAKAGIHGSASVSTSWIPEPGLG